METMVKKWSIRNVKKMVVTKKILSILLVSVILFGCKKNGVEKSYYDNGQLEYEKNWKDGKKDGHWKSYYENGQLVVEEGYINDKLDWKKHYYDEGQLLSDEDWEDGTLKLFKFYYQNGQLRCKRKYKSGSGRDGEILTEKCWDLYGNEMSCEGFIW